jgi:putative transport protein
MEAFFRFLGANPYILLFLVVGLAVWMGRFTIMVASAIVVGAGVATVASMYGVKLQLDNFAKSLFYYLFMYGVGLRVGPSFINSLKGDGIRFAGLAVLCSIMGLMLSVLTARMFELPPGAAGGILAGAMTMSAAIGSAEQAVTSGAYTLPPGSTADQVSAMIALSYGVTYIWGTVGIILICKYLPRWWGVDARAAAKAYEEEFGVKNVDDSGLTGYRPAGIRAYRVTNPETAGKTVAQFRAEHPMYRVINVVQGSTALAVTPEVILERGSVVALGGRLEDLTERMGLVGPEVADQKALNIPLDQAEILVTNQAAIDRPLKDFRNEEFAGQVQLIRIERGGAPLPIGLETTLQRMDVLFVAGIKNAVSKAGALFGRIARPSTSTDLLTLALGMILGFLIGKITVPIAGSPVGLGNAGGLLVAGVIVSSLVSRLRFFGNTPNAARNILEDLGLIVFIAIVGVNAGATLLQQLTGSIALYIFLAGFITCTIPPIIVWAIGYHVFNINAAVLMGGVAGARSHSGPAREASAEIGSSVPWIGFPVGYAVSGVLLTVFGYVAMVLS